MDPENYLVLRDTQNWAARSHRELYDSVHHFNDPGQAGEIGSEWAQFGTELTESAQLITKRVAASESGWTGAAAEGARAAIRELAEWITQTARTAVELGDKVATQGRIMETARATMPEPSTFTLDAAARSQGDPGLAGFTASTADMQAATEKARAAHEQAVAVMETMERQSHDIDASTPVFTLPYNPVTGKAQEPPQPMTFSSTDVASLSGASGPPPVGRTSTPDAVAPPPSPGGAPTQAPAATYSGPAGTGAPAAQSPHAPSYQPAASQPATYQPTANQPAAYQPAAHQPHCDSTGVAAASAPSHQPPAPGYGAPSGGGYQAPAEYRPQQYGAPAPWTPQQNVPRTSTSGTADPRNLPRTAADAPGAAPSAVPGGPNADRSAGRPPTGPGAFGGGSGGGGGGGGAMRGGFPAGHVAAGGPAGGTPMQSGGAAGVTHQGRGPVPAGGVGPGAAAAAGAGSPVGGGPAGGPAGGKGEEDKEHRAASYLIGGNLFEVPGADLPPSVIGASKPKKKQPPAPEPTT